MHSGRQAKVLTVGPAFNGFGGLSALMRMYRSAVDGFRLLPYDSRRGPLAAFLAGCGSLFALPFYRVAGYNVLHAHAGNGTMFKRAIKAARYGQALGFRTIIHIHDDNFRTTITALPQKYIDTLSHADVVAVLSERWKSYFADTLGCRRVETLPNFTGDVRVVRNRAKRRPEEPLRLLFMGKLCAEKGIFDLLYALEPLAAKYQGYLQLSIAGKGDSDAVIDIIDRLKLDRIVCFEGYVDREDKDRLMRLSDILMLPSHTDGMPVGVLEAGVYNMPCITTDVGAIPDVVEHGVNGYIVEADRPEQLTEAIKYYLDNPQQIPVQGQAARDRIAAFLPKSFCPRLEKFYNSLF